MDQAKLLKLPDKTATLVVGNPLIADVAVQPGGIMVVTAKELWRHQLVALDRGGNTLMEHPIQVVGPADNVVLYRGIERESYSCAPNCERRILLGDTLNYFYANLGRASTSTSRPRAAACRKNSLLSWLAASDQDPRLCAGLAQYFANGSLIEPQRAATVAAGVWG